MSHAHEGLIGIEEAARFLAVKPSWLYEQVRLGRVPSYRVGKFRRFRVSELETWLLEHRDGPGNGSPPVSPLVPASRGQG